MADIREHLQNVEDRLRAWDRTGALDPMLLRQAIGELHAAVERIYKILEDLDAAGHELERKFPTSG